MRAEFEVRESAGQESLGIKLENLVESREKAEIENEQSASFLCTLHFSQSTFSPSGTSTPSSGSSAAHISILK